MFGPQWTDKFGTKNDAWEEGLKGMPYSQISAGIGKVMRGALKFYEIDLPRFRELCVPPSRPYSPGEVKRPAWMEHMSQEEVEMHCYANMKMLVWSCRHPKYGLPPHSSGVENLTTEQKDRLWSVARRISHDFFLMRQELGREAVPQEDFLQALERNWARAIEQEPT